MKTLIIVESPAKAKTISQFLGRDYIVESSIGHIRDLPKSAAEVPQKFKGQSWARLGLDIEHEFRPLYVVPADKKGQVAKLKTLLKGVDEVVLATDDDREGEAIAWHIQDELKPKVPVKRMVFHEITRSAIDEAIRNPRALDEHKVEAQEARRALDRLYGFEVSPVLWKKVRPQLSAGRVQSVATRLLVERERERMRFQMGTWWDLLGQFAAQTGEFPATLAEVNGVRVVSGKDFDPLTGQIRSDARVVYLGENDARALVMALEGMPFAVTSTEERPYTSRPYAPFITSTLQQEGARKLGFSASRTMRAAQRLYEGGYITYMRTDSAALSKEALEAARAQVRSMYGEAFLYPSPRMYAKKVKNAQEAHEAIRPSIDHGAFRTPERLRHVLEGDEWRLYDLIWKRTIASQMSDARGRRLSVRIEGLGRDGRRATFAASGKTIDFPGFLRAYVEGSDDPDAALEDREVLLPELKQGDAIQARSLEPRSHTTQPPARYTEASLVASLEERGIGRPSTYATILQTIQDRGYAFKRGTALVPTFTAFATVALLEEFFARFVDYNFTARMEEDLDRIASGQEHRAPYLSRFYFGVDGDPGLKPLIDVRLGEIDARAVATINVPRLEGQGIEVRVGRYGPFLKRGEATAPLPDDLAPDELDLERSEALLNRAGGERVLGVDPTSSLPVIARSGRFGPYVQLGEETAHKTASLLPGDELETIELARALKLLSLPRLVGILDESEVWAMNGRFGPYLKRGSVDLKGESRSLSDPELLFTITLEGAQQLFAQPKTPRGMRGPRAVFQFTDRSAIELRDGRYGPYLSDGESNAALRRGEDATLTAERAREIMVERGKPSKRKPVRARGSKAAGGSGQRSSRVGTKKQSTTRGATKKAPSTKIASTKPLSSRSKTTASTKKASGRGKTDGAAKPKPAWQDLEPFTRGLDPTTAELLRLVNGEGVKVAEAAARLRISPEDATRRYRSSNLKLYAAYRAGRA